MYLAYDFVGGRRYLTALSGTLALLILAVTLEMHGNSLAILLSWQNNLAALMHADADPLHVLLPHQLINLASPLAVLTGNSIKAARIAFAVCALLGILLGGSTAHGTGCEGRNRDSMRWPR